MTESISVRTAGLWLVLILAGGARAQPIINLETAAVGDLWLSGSWLAFAVRESDQADDLNGDGDLDDWFVEARDLESGGRTSFAAPGDPVAISGQQLVLRTHENASGTDWNGDGDAIDAVAQVLDLETGAMRNLGLAIAVDSSESLPALVSGRWLVLGVRERAQGVDLNGDADLEDDVLHVHDLATGSTTNLAIAAVVWGLTADHLIVTIQESAQGADLNGDGDLGDGFLEAVELANVRRQRIVPGGLVLDLTPEWLAFAVFESVDGTDLNGDGDAGDEVVHVHELATGLTLGLGLAGDRVRLAEDRIAVAVSESGQGVDLNGDGDLDDTVIHVRDLRSGATKNTRLAAYLLDLHGDVLLVQVDEAAGGRDLNGDGDSGDAVLHVHELTTGATSSLGLTGGPLGRQEDGFVLVQVLEDQQGQDVNGDGDALDAVPHLLRLERAEAVSLELAVSNGRGPIGHRLVVTVSELMQGADLNGDGDERDNVVHVIDLDLLASAPRFLRGDCNGDGSVAASIADAVAHLLWAFGGGARPRCLAACDSNGDGTLGGTIADVLYLLGWGFLGGPTPPAPFPGCGTSLRPGDAALGCEAADVCP